MGMDPRAVIPVMQREEAGMELQRVVERRRMWRNFDERPVPAPALERIMSNALHAPSAGFSQGWGFLVLTAPDDRALFWKTQWPEEQRAGPTSEGLLRAPVIVVPLSNKDVYLDRYAEPDKGWADRDEAHWPVPYWHIDTGFAAMLILLTAVDEGLGALFFGIWNADDLRRAFGVSDDYTPIGAMTIGYPAPDEPSPSLKRGRKGLEVVVHHGRWGVPMQTR